ncbi:TetR family transcriptional regulator [Subtercola frigoramans]|uniref:AcrR family transcriptional regulator n=1 Tax=Subtercola frigoramans TaxID=120298 RepID=A0ABS2L386_9MICO|nr:TetR family transcriptional regulator [Subtercola frigoramans]MBM7471542.1 AcrR family transcriptional regulator [Subtercola frigoramans]
MNDEPATTAKSTRHSRADVVDAALGILDEFGLPDLTMRRLAAKLDVQPSALYWHFDNKQALLAAVADRIIAGARVRDVAEAAGDGLGTRASERASWHVTTRAEALALRDALLAYRDSAEVVSSTLALGLGAGEAHCRLAAAIASGGFDVQASEASASALLHYLLGHVWHEQQRLQADSLGVVAPGYAVHPESASDVLATGGGASPVDGTAAFEFGLTLLLGGLSQLTRVRS